MKYETVTMYKSKIDGSIHNTVEELEAHEVDLNRAEILSPIFSISGEGAIKIYDLMRLFRKFGKDPVMKELSRFSKN